jgi:DNA-binding transcriptional LysR family regulator
MDIRQLRYFVEVSRQKSFLKAAETLYISQQGLSMSILRMEAELSCKLFKRTGKERLTLTEQGEFLYIHAEAIINEFKICEEYFDDNKNKAKNIHIASAYGIMPDFAGKLVFDFQLEFENILISVRESPDNICENAIDNGEAELGFTLGPIDEQRFESKFLVSRKYCLVVHKSHSLAEEKIATLDMIRTLPIIMVDEDFKMHHIIKNRCRQLGFQPNIRFSAGEIAAIHRFTTLNEGIGISVEKVAHESTAPDVRIIPFDDPEMSWAVFLIKKRAAILSAEAKIFERYIIRRTEANFF